MSYYTDLVEELNEIQDIVPMTEHKLPRCIMRNCEYYTYNADHDKSNYGAFCKYNKKWFGVDISSCDNCDLL